MTGSKIGLNVPRSQTADLHKLQIALHKLQIALHKLQIGRAIWRFWLLHTIASIAFVTASNYYVHLSPVDILLLLTVIFHPQVSRIIL